MNVGIYNIYKNSIPKKTLDIICFIWIIDLYCGLLEVNVLKYTSEFHITFIAKWTEDAPKEFPMFTLVNIFSFKLNVSFESKKVSGV